MTDQQPITREQVEQVFREKTGFSYDTCHRYATAVMPLIEQQQQEIERLRGLLNTLPIDRMCSWDCSAQRQRGTNEPHDSLCPVSVVRAAVAQQEQPR